MRKDLSYRGLPSLAISEGQTTPDPGTNCFIWSTSEGKPLYWDGGTWVVVGTGATGGGGVVTEGLSDVVSYSVAYVGRAVPGSATSAAVWQIQKVLTDVNGEITQLWAGLAEFNQIWNNRASLTYV